MIPNGHIGALHDSLDDAHMAAEQGYRECGSDELGKQRSFLAIRNMIAGVLRHAADHARQFHGAADGETEGAAK